MGCGGSKEVPNFNNNNVEVEVNSTVDNERGNGQEKIKSPAPTESNSIDSPSPIELLPEVKNDITKPSNVVDSNVVSPRNFQKQAYSSKTERTELKTDPGEFDGWTNRNQNNRNISRAQKDNFINELDSEYGKDGIDLTSTSYGAVVSPLKSPTHPSAEGIQFEIVPRLIKKESEEPFDPSALIDIDKFKAVNAPSEVKNKSNKDKTVSIDTEQDSNEALISNSNALYAAPTNYHELYDEDEKVLMESIEQDFVETIHNLPGAVM